MPSLEAALATTDVVGVVTQPDRPKGRGLEVLPCPVKIRALERGLPVFSPSSLKKASDELARLDEFLGARERPDFVLVTAYGNLLPQRFLDLARRGPINVHASLLPRWRGAAPIQRAIEAGDTTTGVCLQRMVMALDAGPLLAEHATPITPSLSSARAFVELAQEGGKLLASYLATDPLELVGQPQDEALVTIAAKIRKEEGFVDPTSWSLAQLHNRVRAFDPWPGVKTRLADGTEMKILETRDLRADTEDGSLYLVRRETEIFVAKGKGLLKLARVQFPSKPAQEASVALRNFFDRTSGSELTLLPL